MASKPIEVLLQEKRICDITNPKLVQSGPSITIGQAIDIMRKHASGYVVIAEKQNVIGIITEVDIVRKVLAEGMDLEKPVSDVMTLDPLVLNPEDTAGKAIDLMGNHRFYHVPLINAQKELVGVLSVRSLIRFLAEFYPTEVYNLPPNEDQIMETREGG